ncbi:MAG TPA: BrnT family toxin [Gammaproteobacteria bacterium]|nr:BrnT family toxin [Gammaproteobacteria bacterium]
MEYEWDDSKAASNLCHHGITFELIVDFAWDKAIIIEDERKDYGESRWVAYGPIGERLYCLVFTVRVDRIRVISLRKANSREVKRYG